MNFASWTKQRQRQHNNLTRLAWSLRDDVGQAQSIEMTDEQTVELENARSIVIYRIKDSKIVRTRMSQDKRTVHSQEQFLLPGSAKATWKDDDLPTWISLSVNRKPPQEKSQSTTSGTLPTEILIRAGVDRWSGKARPPSLAKEGESQ